jgi:hypothetical protein
VLPFELTAENVVRACDEAGINLTLGAAGFYPDLCARAAIVHLASKAAGLTHYVSIYFPGAEEVTGLTLHQLTMIEWGFEGVDRIDDRFYWLGRDIYRLSVERALEVRV